MWCAGGGAARQRTGVAVAAAGAGLSDDDDDDDDAVDKPIFKSTPSNITVSPGDRAALKCQVENLGTKTVDNVLYIVAIISSANHNDYNEKSAQRDVNTARWL